VNFARRQFGEDEGWAHAFVGHGLATPALSSDQYSSTIGGAWADYSDPFEIPSIPLIGRKGFNRKNYFIVLAARGRMG
jgi:hypothetical protein